MYLKFEGEEAVHSRAMDRDLLGRPPTRLWSCTQPLGMICDDPWRRRRIDWLAKVAKGQTTCQALATSDLATRCPLMRLPFMTSADVESSAVPWQCKLGVSG